MRVLIEGIRVTLLISFAIISGFVSLTLFFADLTLHETLVSRIGLAILYYLLFGFIIGLLSGRHFWIAAILGWAAMALGLVGIITNIGKEFKYVLQSLGVVVLPVLVAYLAGWLGFEARKLIFILFSVIFRRVKK